jgi:hypothetical protein
MEDKWLLPSLLEPAFEEELAFVFVVALRDLLVALHSLTRFLGILFIVFLFRFRVTHFLLALFLPLTLGLASRRSSRFGFFFLRAAFCIISVLGISRSESRETQDQKQKEYFLHGTHSNKLITKTVPQWCIS